MFKKINMNTVGKVAGTVFGAGAGYQAAKQVMKHAPKIKETIEFNTSTFKAAVRMAKGDMGDMDTQMIHDVGGVIHNQSLLRAAGGYIGAALYFNDGSKKIVVDDKFFELSVNAQKFILLHEEGHIQLGHLDKMMQDGTNGKENMKERKQAIKEGKVQKIELEADAYAMERVGKGCAISALVEIELAIHVVNKKELHSRVKAIQEA